MKPSQSAKNVSGNSEIFQNFMRKLMQVPHSEIKAKLEAEKAEKRTRLKSASRASVSSPATSRD